MSEINVYLFCYAAQQGNIPIQFYLRRKTTFPSIYMTMSQLPSSLGVLSSVRQGPQKAEIHNSTEVYTKLQTAAQAGYLNILQLPFTRWFSLLESKTRLLSSTVSSLAFHNQGLKPTVLLQLNASTNKYKVQLLTRTNSFP